MVRLPAGAAGQRRLPPLPRHLGPLIQHLPRLCHDRRPLLRPDLQQWVQAELPRGEGLDGEHHG